MKTKSLKVVMLAVALLSFVSVKAEKFVYDPNASYYKIVGKGSAGEQACSGYIEENTFFGTIKIVLSDMLQAKFRVKDYKGKKQIDERTIQYTCSNAELLDMTDYTIIKYKCPYGKDVYFFTCPPLYEGQGTTIYKVVKITK